MSARFPKHPRVKLQSDDYVELCRRILDRDGWRCQKCGRARELQVHHLRFRSALGNDDLGNLITLCFSCHEEIHRSTGSHTA
jgi:5-methylcytosine-specific restriction endonuclease McrA